MIFPKDTGCTILCIFSAYHTILKILQKNFIVLMDWEFLEQRHLVFCLFTF